MQLPLGLGALDWSDWILGLWAAFVGGGATAVYGAFGAAVIDPDHFRLGGTNSFKMAGGMFMFAGVMSMMNFLRTKAVPGRTITATVSTTVQAGVPPKVVTTVQETHTEAAGEQKP